jgi:hypothetical protein
MPWPGLVKRGDLRDAIRAINFPAAGFVDEAQASGQTIVRLRCGVRRRRRTLLSRRSRRACAHVCGTAATRSTRSIRICTAPWPPNTWKTRGRIVAASANSCRRTRTGHRQPGHRRQCVEPAAQPGEMPRAYRSHPHTEMSLARARAARALTSMDSAFPLHWSCRGLPFLLPLPTRCTLVEPLASVMSGRRPRVHAQLEPRLHARLLRGRRREVRPRGVRPCWGAPHLARAGRDAA